METICGLYTIECVRATIFHDGPYKTITDVEFATCQERRLRTKVATCAAAHDRIRPLR